MFLRKWDDTMKAGQLLINGHFRQQRVTGVQRYAHAIVTQFNRQKVPYSWVQPPRYLRTDSLRQIWIQTMMPLKVSDKQVLWSPTNVGPVWCDNHVLTLHDIADQIHPEWFNDQYVQWRKFILPRLLKRVRRIITVSHFSKRSITNYYPFTQDKIEVIYNGVRTDHFYPRTQGEIDDFRQELDLEKPFILSVGSLDERKNIRGLIKAWEKLPGWIKDECNLVVTGESARKFSFKLDSPPDESIRFTGYVKEAQLPILYSAAQVFVYPSFFEGFGLPVLEAMACGTAVITSNTTSLIELADDKALTVDPHEPGVIAEAIKEILQNQDRRKQFETEGIEFAKTFGWEETALKTKKVLEDCVI